MTDKDVVKLIRVHRDGTSESLSGKEYKKFAVDEEAVVVIAYVHGVKYRKVKWKQEKVTKK